MTDEFEMPDGGMLITHSRAVCQGQGTPCCIHDPSDHHMRSFDMHWRSDTGVMERICPHGIGHPDPDHMAYQLSVSEENWWQGVHGCDGCCIKPRKKMKAEDYLT